MSSLELRLVMVTVLLLLAKIWLFIFSMQSVLSKNVQSQVFMQIIWIKSLFWTYNLSFCFYSPFYTHCAIFKVFEFWINSPACHCWSFQQKACGFSLKNRQIPPKSGKLWKGLTIMCSVIYLWLDCKFVRTTYPSPWGQPSAEASWHIELAVLLSHSPNE